ncbi:hypothetical protein BC828DRAFT_405557 [Blastocladiella britannica]|nr:hypothetical protein BC828DRAFT_405557 [Blastocladiella britannica]
MSQPPARGARASRGRIAVSGPTSALTSFLREQGISAREISYRHRRRQEEAAGANGDVAPAAADENDTADIAIINDDDDDDGETDDDVVVAVPAANGSRGSGRGRGASAAAAAAKRRKRKLRDDSSDSDNDPPVAAVPRDTQDPICIRCKAPINQWRRSAFASICRDCVVMQQEQSRATERIVRAAARDNPDIMDADLVQSTVDAAMAAVSSGGAGKGKRRLGKLRETAAEFAMVRDDGNLVLAASSVPSLQDMCIKGLGDLIDSVESLGDIVSETNLRKLARVLCKKRLLDGTNVRLFCGAHVVSLSLFDVTNLDADGLGQLADLTPNLVHLHLAFCGRATDATFDSWIDARWMFLTDLTLKGPYLVTDRGWGRLFDAYGRNLSKLHLEYCTKLARIGIDSLVISQRENGFPLEDLALNYADSLTAETLTELSLLTMVQGLSLLYSCRHLTDEHMDNFTRTMPGLRAIALAEALHLTDKTLFSLRRIHNALRHFSVADVPGFTAEGVDAWVLGHWPPRRPFRIEAERRRLEAETAMDVDVPAPAAAAAAAAATAAAATNEQEQEVNEEEEDAAAERAEWEEYDRLDPARDHSDLLRPDIAPLQLETLVLDRCRGTNHDSVITTLFAATGTKLVRLGLNWMDCLTAPAIVSLCDYAGATPSLRDLDLSWVRCVDDPVLEMLVDRQTALERLTVFGCSRLTAVAATRRWENGRGDRIALIGHELMQV